MADSLRCTVTATLRRFSSCDGKVFVSTDSDSSDLFRKKLAIQLFNDIFKITFYANGSCPKNEGNVSIIFNVINFTSFNMLFRRSLSCTTSVIDASGHKRFPQSFALDCDAYAEEHSMSTFSKSFGFQKYLERKTLLSDSPDLLPDDCLTLCLEIDYEIVKRSKSKYDTDGLIQENGKSYLCTDTQFMRDLCKMSGVFRDMMEFSEDDSGRIPIAFEEHRCFKIIFGFLGEFHFDTTLPDVCDLYLLADKYDMPRIDRLCTQLLTSVLREAIKSRKTMDYFEESVPYISGLAERFEDETLRQILKIYSDIKNKGEGTSGELDASCDSELVTEWSCKHPTDDMLLFSQMNSECVDTFV